MIMDKELTAFCITECNEKMNFNINWRISTMTRSGRKVNCTEFPEDFWLVFGETRVI